jgi:hypothetical protein
MGFHSEKFLYTTSNGYVRNYFTLCLVTIELDE